jgi:hypothetical protein
VPAAKSASVLCVQCEVVTAITGTAHIPQTINEMSNFRMTV